jgi:hypothetical protein
MLGKCNSNIIGRHFYTGVRMNKQQVLKYLKAMDRFIIEVMDGATDKKQDHVSMHLDDLENIEDGLTMAIEFLEGKE